MYQTKEKRDHRLIEPKICTKKNAWLGVAHYFWVKQIEKAAKHISMKTGLKASLKEINQYFKEKAKWSEITDGIMFQDLPISDDLLVKDLYYRKRIQVAVYNLEIIHHFAFHFDMECN